MQFGEKLRIMRAVRGVTLRELEARTGIPNPMISNIESGRIVPTEDWERRLMSALGYRPELDRALSELAESPA